MVTGTNHCVMRPCFCIYSKVHVWSNSQYIPKGKKLQLVNAMQHNKSHSALSYNYQAQRLNKLGVTYYTRGKVTPLVYLTYKIAALTAGFIIGMMFNFPLGISISFHRLYNTGQAHRAAK